jgi:hypothetical protein
MTTENKVGGDFAGFDKKEGTEIWKISYKGKSVFAFANQAHEAWALARPTLHATFDQVEAVMIGTDGIDAGSKFVFRKRDGSIGEKTIVSPTSLAELMGGA